MRKTEYISWIVNYTEISNSGRTTEIKIFKTLKEARKFSKGKCGYITKLSDGGSDWNTNKAIVTLIEYFGGLSPSAQEELTIKNITK